MVWSGKPVTGREKGIAGSSNMADGSHVVGTGKPLTGREKGIVGSSNMAGVSDVVFGRKLLTGREKGLWAHSTWRTEVTWFGVGNRGPRQGKPRAQIKTRDAIFKKNDLIQSFSFGVTSGNADPIGPASQG